MKTRKPLRRSTTPIQRSPIKRKSRSSAETTRIYGSKEFREWLHGLPCQLCGIVNHTQQAHIGKKGMGQKLDWTHTTALCGPWNVGRHSDIGCHAKYDQHTLREDQVQVVALSVLNVRVMWKRQQQRNAEEWL